MERSFKRQGVVTETIRDTWYKETLKKRKELGLDIPEDEIKQELEEVGNLEDDLNLTETTANSAEDVQEPQPSTSKTNQVERKDAQTNKMKIEDQRPKEVVVKKEIKSSNKEIVRAEIKEIEEKLKKKKEKKKQEKVASKVGDLEDGECIDSEEDFDTVVVTKTDTVDVNNTDNPSIPTQSPESKSKQREDYRKRWNEGRRSSSSHPHQDKDRRGREKERQHRDESRHREYRHDRDRHRDSHGRRDSYHDQRGYKH